VFQPGQREKLARGALKTGSTTLEADRVSEVTAFKRNDVLRD
jgi:hypothetical protein